MKNSSSLKLERILKSKTILWILFVIALVNMYAYVASDNDLYIAFMFLIGFILTFFTKNMVVVLFWCIAIPNLIRFAFEWKSLVTGMNNIRLQEGLENKEEAENQDQAESTEKKSNEEDLIAQAEAELSGVDPDTEKKKAKLANSGKNLDKIQDKLQTIIKKAKDGVENIDNRAKRDEMKNLIELEENIVDQLGIIGEMLKNSKKNDLKASTFSPSPAKGPSPAKEPSA